MSTANESLENQGAALSKRRRLQLAVVLGALSTIGPLSIDMYLPALPDLAAGFHASASSAQLSLSCFLVGLAAGQLVSGPLSDVYGRRRPLLIGMMLYTLASLLCAFSPTIGALAALRLVQGLAGSVGVVISRAAVRDLYSGSELTKFFTLLMIVNGVGPIAAPVIGGQLLRVTDWKGVFLTLFAAGLLFCLMIVFRLPETLPPERRHSGGLAGTVRTFGTLLRNRMFMGFVLTQSFVTAAMFAYISGSSFVLQELYGVSAQTYSLIFAMNGLGIILFGQVGGRLAPRLGERRILEFSLALSLGGALLLLGAVLLDGPLPLVLAGLFAVVGSVGPVGTATFSLAMQDQGETAGSASALLGLLPLLMGSGVAPLVGLGGGGTALPMAAVITGVSLLALAAYRLTARGLRS
ncbi:multidrug effflux MFS transporter [Paenibacillus glufosinatiresistens]|uniref:multidrug effflux MFS transporter n=1 Tax=Paenibacillus glufosinatiresistens TaxID=3070657 RepID=UPI00286E94E8|nr:multidrug effflux MFS transporter [Paenibacillus sp. YX.27]